MAAGQVKRAIVSHIGLNPVAQKKMMAGELEIELVPQGTLVERIRAGGYGSVAFLPGDRAGDPGRGRQADHRGDGRPFILEKPIRGDFALLACHHADYVGNLGYVLTAHNFNLIMALAGKVVIAEAEHIVPVGKDPAGHGEDAGRGGRLPARAGCLMTAAIDPKEIIARRVAREIRPGMLVNLGIGLPSLVANYLPQDAGVFFQAENGVIGLGARPPEGMEEVNLTDAGGGFVTTCPAPRRSTAR